MPCFGGSLQRIGGRKGEQGEHDARELWLMFLPTRRGFSTVGTTATTMYRGGCEQPVAGG